MGIISEAGCPAIADPGADVVAIAQRKNIRVVPLVGASSIILSLMASGFNGQSFAFVGYLPIDKKARIQRLKQLESHLYFATKPLSSLLVFFKSSSTWGICNFFCSAKIRLTVIGRAHV